MLNSSQRRWDCIREFQYQGCKLWSLLNSWGYQIVNIHIHTFTFYIYICVYIMRWRTLLLSVTRLTATLCVAWCLIWWFASSGEAWSYMTPKVLTESLRPGVITQHKPFFTASQCINICAQFVRMLVFGIQSFMQHVEQFDSVHIDVIVWWAVLQVLFLASVINSLFC